VSLLCDFEVNEAQLSKDADIADLLSLTQDIEKKNISATNVRIKKFYWLRNFFSKLLLNTLEAEEMSFNSVIKTVMCNTKLDLHKTIHPNFTLQQRVLPTKNYIVSFLFSFFFSKFSMFNRSKTGGSFFNSTSFFRKFAENLKTADTKAPKNFDLLGFNSSLNTAKLFSGGSSSRWNKRKRSFKKDASILNSEHSTSCVYFFNTHKYFL
jgi:hypothetical protein